MRFFLSALGCINFVSVNTCAAHLLQNYYFESMKRLFLAHGIPFIKLTPQMNKSALSTNQNPNLCHVIKTGHGYNLHVVYGNSHDSLH